MTASEESGHGGNEQASSSSPKTLEMPQPAEKAPRNEAHSDNKTRNMTVAVTKAIGSTTSPPPKRSNDCQSGNEITQTKNTHYKSHSEDGTH